MYVLYFMFFVSVVQLHDCCKINCKTQTINASSRPVSGLYCRMINAVLFVSK